MQKLRVLQANLQHKKAATATLCRILMEGNIDVALIQEPWLYKGKVGGLGEARGELIYDYNSDNVRACIFVKTELHALKLTNLCFRDQAAIKLKLHMAGTETEAVLASTYLPYDSIQPPPSDELRLLEQHCRLSNQQMIVGMDANSHHTTWGSTDINRRGENLLDFIISKNLEILNQGNEPTFMTKTRKEVLDITLASPRIKPQITRWQVSKEPSLSDHRHVYLEISEIARRMEVCRDPRRTCWEKYRESLSVKSQNIIKELKNSTDIELAASQLQEAIVTSFHENCPLIKKDTRKDTSWWNKDLLELRAKTRSLFNRAKKTGKWEEYHATLTTYNTQIRKAKKDSWRKHCQEVENTTEAARLQKILSKDPANPVGTIKKPNGNYTSSGRETLQILMQTHLPESSETEIIENLPTSTCPNSRARKEDWSIAKEIITYEKIEWAIDSFDPYKAPGPDEINPALLQQGKDIIIPQLCRLLRASLATGYIPLTWRKARMVFIPKPGKDYSQARAFRPITLSSFVMKTIEKLIDRHVRETSLQEKPLHANQHAYQSGKSCESALHQLVARVEKANNKKEVALVAFLDIEGAFDRTSFKSMNNALSRHNINNTIGRWVDSMLRGRQVQATLNGDTIEVAVAKGCPQGGVLSPLLWDLVVDELLNELNKKGIYTQGYADDIVIIIMGKNLYRISRQMQQALKIVEDWCKRVDLKVNPEKTALIPFTKKRKLEGLSTPTFFEKQIQYAQEVKYLGVILDAKLTWNAHIAYAINKSKMALMATRRAVGKTWGLAPHITHWLYTTVVKPKITYGATVWWPKVEQSTAKLELSKLQRLACICIMGAMSTTPTAAMETILNLPPLDIVIKAEARMGAYRLKCNGNWYDNHLGHTKIESIVTNSLLEMRSDIMTPKINTNKPFKTQLSWENKTEETLVQSGKLVWYTDGSKTDNGSGAGVYGLAPRSNWFASLGKHTTVFQAEIHAIEICLRENLRRRYVNKDITIFSDSQAAIKALACQQINSKVVWNCLQTLLTLAKHNRVTLAWVPGHTGVAGNEHADTLARRGSERPFIGPEPAFGIPKTSVRGLIKRWMHEEHRNHWHSIPRLNHSKRMVAYPSTPLTCEILKLNRKEIRQVTGLLTGHCAMREHLHRMGIYNDEPTCRLCDEDDESAAHIIFECPALTFCRSQNLLEDVSPREADCQRNLIKGLLLLARASNLLE